MYQRFERRVGTLAQTSLSAARARSASSARRRALAARPTSAAMLASQMEQKREVEMHRRTTRADAMPGTCADPDDLEASGARALITATALYDSVLDGMQVISKMQALDETRYLLMQVKQLGSPLLIVNELFKPPRMHRVEDSVRCFCGWRHRERGGSIWQLPPCGRDFARAGSPR